MKRVARYIAVVLVVLCGAVLFGFGQQKMREQRQHKQLLAQDEMTFPSQSQHLMKLADTLSREQRDTLFRHHDLSGLFRTYEIAQNGFFGPHEQRLEVVFTQIRRDEAVPARFHIAGLMRVSGVISSIAGTAELRQTRKFSSSQDGIYIATGLFHFQQCTVKKKLLASLDGTVALDFGVASGKAYLFAEEGAIRARSRQFAFEGNWMDALTGKKQRVIWANEFAPVANAVLGDFDIGGRMATVNPKYRKYGWPEYFQNDEWWADSPKPSLNL